MDNNRVKHVRRTDFSGDSVIYMMSRDQRVRDNHALLHAQEIAIANKVPLYVLFALIPVPGRSREHYTFMMDGLVELASMLASHDIQFVMRNGKPSEVIHGFAREVNAGAIVFDFSPLKGPRELVRSTVRSFRGSIDVVDAHNIIPAWVTSDKQEFAAHTIRRKIHKHLVNYLKEPGVLRIHPHKSQSVDSISFADAKKFVEDIPAANIQIDLESGEQAVASQLATFISDGLLDYARRRNDFSDDHQSNLSPYLHYGQISSLRVALEVMNSVNTPPLLLREARMAQAGQAPSHEDGMNALFEEMIVRKELSDNYCLHNSNYRSLAGAPDWAIETLRQHRDDPRDFVYNADEWENAKTHDDAWNAAQRQLTKTGKLHGYLRMYWAKKLLEWSATPEDAVRTAIHLNDKYSIDGGDPNGYAGILWAIAGLHDRPWAERSVYGKVRYMNAAGLRRKYDLSSYIETWS